MKNKNYTSNNKTKPKKNKINKDKYKVRNWKEYNKSLVQRGSLTLWISEDIEDWWYSQGKGVYSDRAIETMLVLKSLYNMPLRMLEGYVRSLFKLTNINLEIPDYSTVSRRAGKINVPLRKTNKDNVSLILDSSGVKVYGEGEWKVRKHGWCYRRTWRKMHIAIDTDGEIRAVESTHGNTHDSIVTNNILNQEEVQISDFYGDGAYDTYDVYQFLLARNIKNIHIPPQRNAKIQIHGNTKSPPYPRDENLRAIRKSTRAKWKHESGYHKRSLVENTMYRFKTSFGERLSFRNQKNQDSEIVIKCNILNTFYNLGMPDSYLVTET